MLIDGAVRLDNPNGTAPGQWIDLGSQVIALLPGPPREMGPMLEALVAGLLGARAGRARTLSRGLKVAGRSESAVEATLQPLYAEWRVAVAADRGDDPRRPAGASNCTSSPERRRGGRRGGVVGRHRSGGRRARPRRVHHRDETLEELAGRLLHEAGWRVAVAESCTGGMLGARLTDVPGSSAWVDGGVIAYSNALKTVLAGVPPALIAEHGAVSEPVALALAAGVRARCRRRWASASPGIAGPDGGTEAKPVGTVFIALHTPAVVACRQARFVGDRAVVRQQSVSAALDMLRLALTGHDPVGIAR